MGSKQAVGIDIGSRTVKIVELADGVPVRQELMETGVEPIQRSLKLLGNADPKAITATGYGRHLLSQEIGCDTVSEIKAFAVGAWQQIPGCRTVIDIGGQDCKVIRVEAGRVGEFSMNDRCAAGTGRFLEMMARSLDYTLQQFCQAAMEAEYGAEINSMCTVFAESEVISLIARGEDPKRIALGLHQSIVARIGAQVGSIGWEAPVVLAGGGALSRCLRSLLAARLGTKLIVSDYPQFTGALGAALTRV